MARRLAPVPDSPLRVVRLIRVSKAREEMISPELQDTAIDDFEARRGMSSVARLEGLDESGSKAGSRWWARLDEAIAMVERREADVIVGYRFDRAARNRLRWALAVHRVEEAGGQILSATEDVDPTTATGRFTRGMLAEVAAWRAEEIGERWKEVLDRRRRLGLPTGRAAAFGYRKTGRSWQPDEETAPLLAEAYRRYTAGEGWRALSVWLAGRGVTNPHTGQPFTPRGIGTMLDSGFGAGLLHTESGDYYPGAHPPVISEKEWQAFRAARGRRRKVPARLVTATTPLAGLCRCDACGYRMWARADPTYGPAYTYYCTSDQCAGRARVTRKRAEQAVRKRIGADVDDELRAAAAQVKVGQATSKAEVAALSRQLAAADRAMRNLTKQRIRELVPPPVFEETMAELIVEREQLDAELEKTRVAVSRPAPSRRQLAGVLADWDRMDAATLNRILVDLVAEVRVIRPASGGRCALRVRMTWEPEAL